ncbi:hypothetical protein [Streptococcus cuniculi]|uniref:Uncharacterized protein n=1 Tax=Streptococcus cuniculi TaxID=1432788 RepID=A0A4Y9JD69_9STRE|nr:hypothetical protein [Streptococcus cuniculi]MBF0778157.1 hypothetical protein [Streptococcus cuniculi]TFU97899.1 hypothetical protein E4T82_05390 [Streptococcus cuniculi]
MKIRLPYVEPIETECLPENLEDLVKKSFVNFTKGTNKDYTFEDKLLYLDNLRKSYLRDCTDTSFEITKILGEAYRHQLDEHFDILEKEDVFSTEFMEYCFDKGFMPLRDTWDKWSSSANDRAHKAIVAIIKIIINFEWKETDEHTRNTK